MVITYTIGEQIGAIVLVIFLSAVGGMLLSLLAGYKFAKFGCFPGYTLKPLLTKVRIPPIIAMIVVGCVVRNFFGSAVSPYNNKWA